MDMCLVLYLEIHTYWYLGSIARRARKRWREFVFVALITHCCIALHLFGGTTVLIDDIDSIPMKYVLFLAFVVVAQAWHDCPDGGFCPDGNTCCPGGGCVSGHDEEGACCGNNEGCREGFECATDEQGLGICARTEDAEEDQPATIPRYQLCTLDDDSVRDVQALTMPNTTIPASYLSSMGSLEDDRVHANLTTLVLTIHGSGRTADDYLCGTLAAVPTATTAVIAPWFVQGHDPSATDTLRWSEWDGIWHPWRFGGNAVNAPTISAYAVVDRMVQVVQESASRFPNLESIVVVGHSAGGQYVQRWALLTSQWDSRMRAVVANPKSLCFLDHRRYNDNETLVVPSDEAIDDCPTYNQWEWGLGEGDYLNAPYKDASIAAAGGVAALIDRYPSRDVVYLAGELDVIPNGDCEAKLQGDYRRIRSQRFMAALREIYGRPVHHRLVVAGVHHDHCLMYQSPEGQEALLGKLWSLESDEVATKRNLR